ncbi:MAG: response regulator transcription factor [Bacteroidia bacterium]|nr:response regulator transcription factor [Bacteroidia bacterium]
MKIVKVAVFDDNAARRDGLKVLLNAMEDMDCVGLYEDCRNVVEKVAACQPDVVLMDINMPHVDGIEGLKLLKQEFPGLKIIMQTIFEDEDKIVSAICAGADGYILKQMSPMDLLEGITEVMAGGAPLTPTVAKKVLSLFSSRNSKTATPTNSLTKREQEILKLLVEGYSYKMIAEKCFITYATVNTHIVNIYEKLQVNSSTAAVSKAIKEGLV